MRLIDADALKAWVEEQEETKWGLSTDEVWDAIDAAPTIDPVKHGKWVKDGAYWKDIYCSVCGEMALSPSYWEVDLCRSDYCPWCGARMEEKK